VVEVLGDTFPVPRTLVGAAFFASMARLFVTHNPPRSPALMLYGDDLPGARASFHPSAAVMASRYAIAALWAAHQDVGDIAKVDPTQPQCALVLRQQDDVIVIAIER